MYTTPISATPPSIERDAARNSYILSFNVPIKRGAYKFNKLIEELFQVQNKDKHKETTCKLVSCIVETDRIRHDEL